MPSPCETLRELETTLHGLSFSHSSAHLPTSTALADLLRLFAVGLLRADHGEEAYHALPHTFARLVTHSSIDKLLDYSQFDPQHVDVLVMYYWRTASEAVKTLQSPRACSDLTLSQCIIQLLHASHILLCKSANAPVRRSVAANQAAGDLLFVALSLDSTFANHHVNQCVTLLRDMRRCDTNEQLLASFPVPLDALLLNSAPPQDIHHNQFATPPMQLHSITTAISQTANTRRVPQVLSALLPFVEHVDQMTRLDALDALHLLLCVPNFDWQVHTARIIPCLVSALIWRDVQSALRVAPMLRTLVPLLLPLRIRSEIPLTATLPQEWLNAVQQLLDNAVYQLQHVAEEEQRLTAGVKLGEVLVYVAKGRLIRHAKLWVSVLASVMGRQDVAELLMESIKWTWIVEEVYRVAVFDGCFKAAMEKGDEYWEHCLNVLKVLAESGRGQVHQIVQDLKPLAERYASLKRANLFLQRVQEETSQCGRDHVGVGTVVDRVFTLHGES